MSRDYLHNHRDFPDLIRIVARERSIDPALVEKDYWIMHCLYGLQQLGMTFELKGGTSLSKGFLIVPTPHGQHRAQGRVTRRGDARQSTQVRG